MSFFNRLSSKNAVSTTVAVVQDVMSDVISNCNTRASNTNIIKVSGGSTLRGNRISQKIKVEINSECFHDSFLSISQQQKLESKLEQAARSSLTGLYLGSIAEAENVIRLYVEEVTKLCNTSILNCIIDYTNQNIIEVSEGSMVTGNWLSQEIAGTLIKSCALRFLQQSKQIQDLDFLIQQSSSSSADNSMIWGLLFVLIIFGVFAVVFLTTKTTFSVFTFRMGMYIILLICILGIVSVGWFFHVYKNTLLVVEPVDLFSKISKISKTINYMNNMNNNIPSSSSSPSVIMTLDTAKQICGSDWSCYGFYFFAPVSNEETSENIGKVRWISYRDWFRARSLISSMSSMSFTSSMSSTAVEEVKDLNDINNINDLNNINVWIHDRPPDINIDPGINGSLFFEFSQILHKKQDEILSSLPSLSSFQTKVKVYILYNQEWREVTDFVLPSSVENLTEDVFVTKKKELPFVSHSHQLWIDISQFPILTFYQKGTNATSPWQPIQSIDLLKYQSCGFEWTGKEGKKGCVVYQGKKSRLYFTLLVLLMILSLLFVFTLWKIFRK